MSCFLPGEWKGSLLKMYAELRAEELPLKLLLNADLEDQLFLAFLYLEMLQFCSFAESCWMNFVWASEMPSLFLRLVAFSLAEEVTLQGLETTGESFFGETFLLENCCGLGFRLHWGRCWAALAARGDGLRPVALLCKAEKVAFNVYIHDTKKVYNKILFIKKKFLYTSLGNALVMLFEKKRFKLIIKSAVKNN